VFDEANFYYKSIGIMSIRKSKKNINDHVVVLDPLVYKIVDENEYESKKDST
jgi:hypothetical protein